jgi:hypothetical protein
MTSVQTTLLTEAFIEVLQRQTFLFAEPTPVDSLPIPELGWIQAAINFTGPFSGAFELALAPELQREATANILGIHSDDSITQASCNDALKELLNVVSGHLLTTLAGETAVFDLGIPTVSPDLFESTRNPLTAQNAMGFEIDGHSAVLCLRLSTNS